MFGLFWTVLVGECDLWVSCDGMCVVFELRDVFVFDLFQFFGFS